MKKIKILLLTLVILLGVAPKVSATSVQSFYFENFEADYYLTKDEEGVSHLKVKEKLTAVFPETDQNHGITRVIPRTSDAGRNVTAESWEALDFSAKRNGVSEPVAKVETEETVFTVYLGSASEYVHGTQVYELEYEFENVILGYTGLNGETTYDTNKIGHEELYWDTNGTGWAQEFENLTARVHYDAEIQAEEYKPAGVETPSCYVGRYMENGSDDCLITETSDGYEFKATRALSAGENLTFDIMFKPGAFVIEQNLNYNLVMFTAILAGGLVIVIVMALVRRAKYAEKRRFYKDSPVPPEFTPVKDLSLAEAGLLSIKKTKSPEVATLMNLAVTHKIKLVKGEKKTFGGYKWEIECEDLDEITESEMQVLRILNGGSRPANGEKIEVKTQAYSSTVASLAQAFKNDARKSLVSKEYFEKSAGVGGMMDMVKLMLLFFGLFGAVCVLGIAGGLLGTSSGYMVGGEALEMVDFVMMVLIIAVPIVASVSNNKYKIRTMEGLRKVVELDGLRLYMEMAEEERMKFLQSVEGADTTPQGVVKLYEKLLPYAVLFGIEGSWLAELQKYYEMPEVSEPYWYMGTGPIVMSDLSNFGSAMRSSITGGTIDVSSSGSSSSGFSGGGGGGFSGGGGGGGGGGGW